MGRTEEELFRKPYTKNYVTVTIHFTEAQYWKAIHEEGNIWRRWFPQLDITRAQQLKWRLFISMQYVFWDGPITKKTVPLVCKVEWPVFAMKNISSDAFKVISYERDEAEVKLIYPHVPNETE